MFNTKLRELRNYKGITQAELAKHLDVTQQAVGRWEKAITSPDYETLKKLAAYFNVTTDYLLGRSDNPNAEQSGKQNPVDEEDAKVSSIFDDHDIRALARKTLTDKSPEEVEKKKKKLKQMLEVMFDE